MIDLETPRLILKPHTTKNAEKFTQWENDPELVWVNYDDSDLHRAVTVEYTRRYLREIGRPDPDRDSIDYAIHRKPDGAFIGFGMVGHIEMLHRRCTLGITIGEKSAWGKGYAHEALEAVIGYCFNVLKMNRIKVEIYCFNERSIKLFTGLGFSHEGTLRQSVWKNGQFWDDCHYALLREEWEHRSGAGDRAMINEDKSH